MKASDDRNPCRDAEAYYYDLMSHTDADVPEPVRDHVQDCSFCQQRIEHLHETLFGTPEGVDLRGSRTDSEIVEVLSRHLVWLGQEVGCRHVKPFLPSLVRLSSKIRIPTPITVHIEQCPPCGDDLAALGELNLTADQLGRLGRLYAASVERDPARCRQMQSAIAGFAAASLTGIDPEMLDHLGRCPRCRAEVYRRRQHLLEAILQETAFPPKACGREVSPTDMFDHVVPCGMTPVDTSDMDPSRSELAAHVRSCPTCMDKLQTLHCTVYGVLERADSGVTTVYDTADDAESVRAGAGDVPRRRPVGAQVRRHEPEWLPRRSGSATPVGTRVRHAVAALGFRGNVTIVLAAAAVVVLGILFFSSAPTASGTNVGEILKAIEQAANVHITKLGRAGPDEPIQEIWAARRLGKLVTKTGPERVLYDVNGGSKTTVTSDPETVTSARMNPREWEGAKTFLITHGPLVLGNLPPNAEVRQVASDAPAESGDGLAVYEISWSKRMPGDLIVSYRWNIFVDPPTQLPQRIESLQMLSSAGVWEQAQTTLFEYLSEREMQDVIEAMFPPQ